MATAIKDLPPGQPNYGIVTYNNYTFGVFRNLKVTCTPVYDEADRVVTHLKYMLRCYGCVMQNNVLNTHQINMDAMQRALTVPGQQLIFKDVGFDLGVDTNVQRDIIWGPKPRILEMRPWGEICWEFDWEIEFNISRCISASAYMFDGALMAWNYSVAYQVGENGLVESRVTTGYLQIVQTVGVNNPQAVLVNVDSAWDRLTFNIPYGFRRVSNQRTINNAKNRIDFTIIDAELPGAAFPPGVVKCEARLDITSQPSGLAEWFATLRASYEISPGYPKSLAVSSFLVLMKDRVGRLKSAVTGGINPGQGLFRATIVPVRLAISRDLYGRTTDIACSFRFAAQPTTLLANSGLWQPLPQNDWQQWATSLAPASQGGSGVTGNKGYSDVSFDPSQDRLVTVCVPDSVAPTSEQIGFESIDDHDADGAADENAAEPTDPTDSGLYLVYESRVREYRSENFVVHRFAQQYQPGQNAYQDNLVDYQSAPDNTIVMVGRAARIDQVPEPPVVTSVGGNGVEMLRKNFVVDDRPTTLAFGHKVYLARWAILYRVKGEPAVLAPQDAPAVVPQLPEPLE